MTHPTEMFSEMDHRHKTETEHLKVGTSEAPPLRGIVEATELSR